MKHLLILLLQESNFNWAAIKNSEIEVLKNILIYQ